VDRSLTAVVLGTFTLRFSTGLTGGLLVFYLAGLADYPGGRTVSAFEVGVIAATYFLAELVLSPLFGVASDRFGARVVMQLGPIFGAVAVIVTAFTTDVLVLGVTRWVEGAAAAASIPSILGYIALVTSGDDRRRGQAVARFEAATLAGLGGGIVAAGALYGLLGRNAFLLNAGIYAVSFAIYRFGVGEPAGDRREAHVTELGAGGVGALAEERFNLARYRRVLASAGVWLLAPTWIALNAFVGVWTSQSIFQLVQAPRPGFEEQLLMGGFAPIHVSAGLAAWLAVFFAGLLYWGNRFRRFRRTTLIAIGIFGGLALLGAIFGLNHSAAWGLAPQLGLAVIAAGGLFVLAGATPAALGLLADISETHPRDRGAIMGLYSVFLAVGQIVGSVLGGAAAEWQGVDGLLGASLLLMLAALLPVQRLRASEHLVGVPHGHEPPPPAKARRERARAGGQ
jgi:MFS family permease